MSTVRIESLFRLCSICRGPFEQRSSLQDTCSDFACRAEKRRQRDIKRQARAERAKLRSWRQESKSIGKLLSDAQRAVNRYVLELYRDHGCISCRVGPDYDGAFHAGHYRSRGAAPQLRFNLDNLRKQCAQCNTMKSGNVIEFRKRLVAEIGIERVEALENDNSVKRFERDEAIEIRRTHAALFRELRAIRESKG